MLCFVVGVKNELVPNIFQNGKFHLKIRFPISLENFDSYTNNWMEMVMGTRFRQEMVFFSQFTLVPHFLIFLTRCTLLIYVI